VTEDDKVQHMDALASVMLDAGIPLMKDMEPVSVVDTLLGMLFYISEQAGMDPDDLMHRFKIAKHHYYKDEEYDA